MCATKNQTNLTGNFPDRLATLRQAKGWTKSELARRIWGTVTNAAGYEGARNRDRIGVYERGGARPTEENLAAIAEALGVSVEELAPELVVAEAFQRTSPEVEMRLVDGGVFLRVNMVTDLDTANQVVALLSNARG